MPMYEYIAIDGRGKQTKGTLDAESVRVARQKLRAQGIFPTDVKESHQVTKEKSRDVKLFFRSDKVKLKDLAVATRQLATLLGAAIPVVETLSALAEQVESAALKRVLIAIREDVQEGSSLGQSMQRFPKAFPKLYVNMVRSGEASGTLDMVAENLADYLEAQLELRRKVSSSLFYPILMLCFCSLVVIGLLTFVVPTIVDIFIKQGAELPLPTQIVLAISHGLTSYWPIIALAVLGLISAAKFYHRQERGRAKIDALQLKLPVYGSLLLKINTARIARTLGTLLSNGVGLLEALEIVKNIVQNVHLRKALDDARDGVREGRSLAKELAKSRHFPPMLIHMIAVGETSGRLEQMLAKAGKSYENDVNATLAGLTSLIEPLMMIVLGFIVFSIVLSVLLPMIDLISVVQKR